MKARPSAPSRRAAPLYAALRVPDFPAAALQRGERRPPPTVVACGEPPNRFVFASDLSARKRGVRDGMALAAARALHGASGASRPLRVLDRDERAERRAQELLLGLAERATPQFEDVAPGLLVLDFGGLRDPYAAAAELAAKSSRLGLGAGVGVSGNRLVALCAAGTRQGVTHVYPGQEAGFLQSLPLSALPLDRADLETLGRWGVRRIGELARLPEEQLAERFGERGGRMARLARGEEESVLDACESQPQVEFRRDFEWDVDRVETLLLAMSGLLDRLGWQLQGSGQAAASLTARLQLAGGGAVERTLDLPYPISDARTLLALMRIELSARPPGGAVDGVRLSAVPVERRLVQRSLFAPDLPGPEELAVTLARLAGLVGGGRVGAPVLLDTHRRGAGAVEAFRPALGGGELHLEPAQSLSEGGPAHVKVSSQCRPQLMALAPAALAGASPMFRAFRPSRPAKVALERDRPVRLEAGGACGPVTASAGPWHATGEWWTAGGWQRREWDVEVKGRLYRACCEASTGDWFLAGEYD